MFNMKMSQKSQNDDSKNTTVIATFSAVFVLHFSYPPNFFGITGDFKSL